MLMGSKIEEQGGPSLPFIAEASSFYEQQSNDQGKVVPEKRVNYHKMYALIV